MTTLFKKLRDLGFAEAHAATNAAVDLRAPDVVDQHVRNLEGHEDNMRRGLIELRTQIQVAEERSRKLASDYALANGRAQSLLTKAKAADPSRKVQLEQAARLSYDEAQRLHSELDQVGETLTQLRQEEAKLTQGLQLVEAERKTKLAQARQFRTGRGISHAEEGVADEITALHEELDDDSIDSLTARQEQRSAHAGVALDVALQDLNGASDPAQQIEADEGFEALKAGIYAAPANPTANT